jgi:hypothetical protein
MNKNIGSTDRIIRFVIGAILIGVTVMTRNWIFGVLALYPIVTAVLNHCPAKEAMQFNPR